MNGKLLLLIPIFLILITGVNAQFSIIPTDSVDKILDKVRTVDVRIQFHGTEYFKEGEQGTIFLQLTENYEPINNGSCYLDIYYPNIPNQTHPILIKNAPMIYLNGSNGVYYYDLTIQNYTGVYMLSADCSYAYNMQWRYEPDDTDFPNRTIVTGTYYGSCYVLNSREDFLYTKCDSTLGAIKTCEAYYDFNTSGIENISKIELYFLGEASISVAKLVFYVWNWTGNNWIMLTNNLTFSGTATSTETSGIDDCATNTVPTKYTINDTGTIRIRLYTTSGTGFTQYNNWLTLRFLTTEGTVTELKGSSELHVTNIGEIVYQYFWNLGDPYEKLISNHDYCIDNTTLRKEILKEKCIDTKCYNFTDVQDIICSYGCQNDECLPSPFWSWVTILIIIIIVIVAVWIFYPKGD